MWGWLVRGLEGCIGVMEKMHGDNAKITEHFAGELLKLSDRLNAVAVNMDGRVKDRQA